ncbi:MAG: CDP-alcohol phosphatidyltransferase family protein [Dehalococcoidia bacterium]|jgi:CDP-L-myo-inositol myo-inositolphosphotransferase|nr:CDP-alcohol phosphatidyltransferase family protein [Dehalococcoidia bacterium]
MNPDGPALTKSSDGPVSLLINRRISARFSGPMARAGFSPNAATAIALLIGVGACAAWAAQIWWAGGLLMQFSSVFSGVDGEIARRTGKASGYGDFFDTVVDRLVEYAGVAAIAYGLAQTDRWDEWAWPLGVFALGATFMLAASAEKYRSVMHENYPKRQFEPLFAYLVSGRDVRVFYLAVISVAATWNVDVMFWGVAVITALVHLNFVYRVMILRGRMET